MDRRLALAVTVSALLAFWLWDSIAVYPLKLFVVWLHEAGHAIAALLAGGEVVSISVDLRQGGLTHARVPEGLFARLLLSSGGYVGSTLFGAAILFAASRLRSGRPVLFALSGFLVVGLALWVRDVVTLAFTAAMAVVLFVAGRSLPPEWSRSAALFLGSFCGLYSLWDIRDDLLSGRALDRPSDAQQLAALTGIPALLWGLLWGALSIAVLWAAVRDRSPREPWR